MTDTDLTSRAAQALRTAHSGQREGSGFTRARILVTLQKRKRRRWRWVILSPFGALLLAGSAWAQGTGQWPRLWHALAVVFVPAAARDSRTPSEPRALPAVARQSAPVPSAVPSEPPAVPSEASATSSLPPPPASAQPARREPVAAKSSAARSLRAAAPRTHEPDVPAADPELLAFRRAHDLHFAGAEPRAAIQAFAAYLAAYPDGRFVPEARYNTALDWLKLGDKERARQVLKPFADGVYDGYRRDEAVRLLDALR